MAHLEPEDFPSQAGVPGIPWWHEAVVEPAFMKDFPPTLWEDLALAHIQEHMAIEAGAEEAYEDLGNAEDPQVRYLAAMIAADEHRHHQLLSDIAEALKSRVGGTADQSAIAGGEVSRERREALLGVTRKLLAMEEDDADKLKALRRELHRAPERTVWPLLVEIMELDTEKHVRILKGIEGHLRRDHW